MEQLRLHFRPEFLNRVDETLIFHALDKKHILEIVDIQIKRFASRLKEHDITLEISEEAKKHLAEVGYDPNYGARPLKRTIVKELETPVSRMMIGGELPDGSTLKVGKTKAGISFSTK